MSSLYNKTIKMHTNVIIDVVKHNEFDRSIQSGASYKFKARTAILYQLILHCSINAIFYSKSGSIFNFITTGYILFSEFIERNLSEVSN